MEKELDLEEICFQMITAAGEAKSSCLEALEAFKEGDRRSAEEKRKEGDRNFAAAHESHGQLVRRESSGEPVRMTLLLSHVEDQIMSVEVIRLMVREFCSLYERLDSEVKG